MADKYRVKAKSRSKASIDAAMAGFAALSVGFVGYAMPTDVFEGLARSLGATPLLAAAEPGSTARYIVVAGAAALTFGVIYALLRALSRIPSAKPRRGVPAEVPADPPRIRRADAHPDNPARWPVFAGSELGDPIPAEQPELVDAEPAGAPAEQPELVDADPAAEDIAPEPEESSVEAAQTEAEDPLTLEVPFEAAEPETQEQPLTRSDEPAAEAAEEPAALAEDAPAGPEFAPHEPFVLSTESEPAPVTVEEEAPPVAEEASSPAEEEELRYSPAEQEPAPVAETFEPVQDHGREAEAASSFVPMVEEEQAGEAEPEPAPAEEAPAAYEEHRPDFEEQEPAAVAPAPVEAQQEREAEPLEALSARLPELPRAGEESVSELVGRLEVGIGRRDRARWLGQDGNEPVEEPAPSEDRLRNAIGMLRRRSRKS